MKSVACHSRKVLPSEGNATCAATIPAELTLLGQFRRRATEYLHGLLLLLLYQAAQYWFDTRLMRAIDAVNKADYQTGKQLALMLMAVALAAFFVRVRSRFVLFFIGRDAEYQLRNALIRHLHRLGPAFFARVSVGDLMSRATNDLAQVRVLLAFGVLNLANTLFALVSAFTVMFAISVPLTFASMVTLPFLAIATRTLARRIFLRTKENQEALGQLSEVVQGTLSAMRVIRAYGLEAVESERFERENEKVRRCGIALANLRGVLGPIMQLLAAVGLVTVFFYGGRLLLSREITAGGLMAFFRALSRLTWPLIAFGYIVAIVQRGRAAHLRLAEVFATREEVTDSTPTSIPNESCALEVSHVSHHFGERQVLDDISLRIEPGERVAIVGETGAGKSTLGRILSRVIVPTKGSVSLGERPLSQWPLSRLRRTVCHSQQLPFLFSSTILQNIAFGLDDPDSEESRRRALAMGRDVLLEREILRLPQGYDTVVGERGMQLSGGQRQRVALGRALLTPSPILVLDDPTSAVDVQTERALIGLLSNQERRRTLIIITHRVSVANLCDRVIVLEQGRVVQDGKAAELERTPGVYARFCQEQRLLSEVADDANQLKLDTERPSSEPESEAMAQSVQALSVGDIAKNTQIKKAELAAFHEEHALGATFDRGLLRRLFDALAVERGWLVFALGCVLATAAVALTRPLMIKEALDRALAGQSANVLVMAAVFISALLLVEQGLSFGQFYLTQVVGARALSRLRTNLMEKMHRLPMSFFDKQPIGRLTTRVTNDIDAINELFASGILGAMGDLLRLFGITLVMVCVDARLSVAAFATLPVVVILVLVLRRPMRESFRAIRGRNARLNAALNEQISGIAVVQAFDQMSRVEREFDQINRDFREANLSAIRYEAIQDGALETIASVAFAAIVLGYSGAVSSYGTVLAFQLYLAQFFEPLSQLSQRYTLLQSAMAGAERVFGLLDEKGQDAPKTVSAEAAAVTPAPHQGDNADARHVPCITFSNVDFSYHASTKVLSSVSFDVQVGEHIALVGPTGSGKSTIVALLLRLYEADQGNILLSGRSIKDLDAKTLRAQFAYVPQEPVLFPGTLLSNIAGSLPRDPDRARGVLHRMDALTHFEKRLGGLNATLLAGGQLLSVGERQLVAFARALYRGSSILLLDEATASVDSDTERRLQRALEATLEHRTAIVIAHRLGTIKTADRVLVLNHGRLVQQGTHRELVASEGLYRRLVQLSQIRQDVIDQSEDLRVAR